MILYPKLYLEKVTDITIEILKKYHIEALILDMDNTLLDFDKKIVEGGKQWVEQLKRNGIKICIASNSGKKEKVEMLSNELGIENYILWSMKPLKFGVKKAQKILKTKNENIAVVGDQIFTDVLAGNFSGIRLTLLVKPIRDKKNPFCRFKRLLEKPLLAVYRKREKKRNSK